LICPECQKEFTPKRPHQRFCSSSCRVNNFAGSDKGLRGAVTAIRKCKGDCVSVTVRFADSDALNALKLRIGEIAEVIK
jgi:hypothetical protein